MKKRKANSRYIQKTPNGNNITYYNRKGRQVRRVDFSHSHAGMCPHVHDFAWYKSPIGWRWIETGVYKLY